MGEHPAIRRALVAVLLVLVAASVAWWQRGQLFERSDYEFQQDENGEWIVVDTDP